ncbi:MAG: polysaccharide lyase 6 family protein [Litorimonas sp.]
MAAASGFWLLLGGCATSVQAAESVLVSDADGLEDAIKAAEPGDRIILADGRYEDLEILFVGEGTQDAPITLSAQTKGDVVLTGQSNLRLAGEHLVVEGLVFKDGYTPTSSVIEFRRNSKHLANNSVVRETVIDGFTNPDRFETDSWVRIYGRNNRFEFNHLEGKGNQGVTLAVRLNSEESQNNNHVIANNYFGPRPILGSNGGETLRIGTSHYSLSDSRTVVENNVFDRTNGELEIISVKSGRNVLRGNSFLSARGTLTLRHGNDNVVERNVFLGNGADHTGGIRVINAGQVVRDNYMEGLTGTRFGGAFTVMNGVPDSPINRYHQVADAVIERNSILGSDRIQLGAGSDEERSAVPVDSVFRNNLVSRDETGPVFQVYDDMSGIAFSDNVLLGAGDAVFDDGFARGAYALERAENGLLYPPEGVEAGAPRDLVVTGLEDVGVSWYPKPPADVPFDSGRVHEVAAEEGALFDALAAAGPGDVLDLAPGRHDVRKILFLDIPVTVRGSGAATLAFERPTLFQIDNGGSLKLDGVEITGEEAPDMVGNSLIRTSPYAMTRNYRLEIVDSRIRDLDVNRFFDVLRGAKSTMADHIRVTNSEFSNISGSVFNLDDETDDYGRYNAEYLTLRTSTFRDIQGPLATLYRGGRDESTFGPHFELRDSTLSNVGLGSRNTHAASVWLHGVQDTDIVGNTIQRSAPFKIDHTVGDPQTDIAGNRFSGTPAPVLAEITSGLAPTMRLSGNEGL